VAILSLAFGIESSPAIVSFIFLIFGLFLTIQNGISFLMGRKWYRKALD